MQSSAWLISACPLAHHALTQATEMAECSPFHWRTPWPAAEPWGYGWSHQPAQSHPHPPSSGHCPPTPVSLVSRSNGTGPETSQHLHCTIVVPPSKCFICCSIIIKWATPEHSFKNFQSNNSFLSAEVPTEAWSNTVQCLCVCAYRVHLQITAR